MSSHVILITIYKTGMTIIPNLQISGLRLGQIKPLTKITQLINSRGRTLILHFDCTPLGVL